MNSEGTVKRLNQNDQNLWIPLLVFIIVAIGFFVPISLSHWTGILIKGILFVLVFFIVYLFVLNGPSDIFKAPHRMDQTSSEEVVSKELLDDENGVGFGKVLSHYIEEFLSIIRNMMVGNCVGLYLYQHREKLVFHVGENAYQRITEGQVVGKDSLIEQITNQRTPVLEDNLPIGSVLEGITDPEIRSFVGVPLIWKDNVVGALAVGGKTTGSFSQEDCDFLDRCGQLLTQVMAICYRGMGLETDQQVYQIHLDLEKNLKSVDTEHQALNESVQSIKKLFPLDRFTFCLKDDGEGIIDYVFGQVDQMNQGIRFPLDEGLNGWVLKRNMPLVIADMQGDDMMRSRYFHNEDTKHGLRSFLGIPMGSEENAWGSISVESRFPNQYDEKAKDVLSGLVILLQIHMERIQLLRKLNSLSKNDIPSLSV